MKRAARLPDKGLDAVPGFELIDDGPGVARVRPTSGRKETAVRGKGESVDGGDVAVVCESFRDRELRRRGSPPNLERFVSRDSGPGGDPSSIGRYVQGHHTRIVGLPGKEFLPAPGVP